MILSDTVGFISELPTELVAAFRATLEEVAEADIILHVRDVAHPDSTAQRADVTTVLDNMVEDHALDAEWRERCFEVLNKIDLLPPEAPSPDIAGAVGVSALTGAGLPDLLAAIDARLSAGMETLDVAVGTSDGARIAWLYEHGEVLSRDDTDERIALTVRLRPEDRARFERETEDRS